MQYQYGWNADPCERPKSEKDAVNFWNTRNNQTQESESLESLESLESKKLDFGNHRCCKCGKNTGIPIEDPFNGEIEMCDMCRTCGSKKDTRNSESEKPKEDYVDKILRGYL